MVASADFSLVSGIVVRRRKARGGISRSHDRSLVHAAAMPHGTYAELHCHSAFSFLDGASPPDEILAEAHRLGYPALALTDTNGIYGSLAFAHAAQPLGLQAITGAEVTLSDGAHVVLLAQSAHGYTNLCRLLPEAHLGAQRLDPPPP